MNKLSVVSAIPIVGLLLACKLQAASITFLPDQILILQIDTSSLAGTTGSIDFQFDPGPNTVESASVAIRGFQGATFTSDVQTGGVTGGPLPNQLSIANSGVLNEDLEDLIFSQTILFTLDFSGVAINNPSSQRPQSGSTFTVGLFSDPNATIPSLIDPGGVAFEADISPSGQFTTVLDSSQASLIPEPRYLYLVLLFALGTFRFRRKVATRAIFH